MATPFTSSMRSLQADNFYGALIGLSFAIILLTTWMLWFFLAKVTMYEVSTNIKISEDQVIANFPKTARGLINYEQVAYLKLDGAVGAKAGPIPAVVTEIQSSKDGEQVETTLVVYWNKAGHISGPKADLTGRVEIAVEHVSPARLVVRAAGRVGSTSKIQVSSQSDSGTKQ